MSNALIALREELRDAGLVDTHYHVGPELIVRRYDVKTLADKAVPFGATLVLKNQFTSYIDSLFLFLCHAQQNQDEKDDSKKKVVVIASIVSSVVATLLIFIFIYWSNAKNIKGKILPNSHILFS